MSLFTDEMTVYAGSPKELVTNTLGTNKSLSQSHRK